MVRSRTFKERQSAIRTATVLQDDPPEPVSIRLTMRQLQQLEELRAETGYRSQAALLQAIIKAVLRDIARKDKD